VKRTAPGSPKTIDLARRLGITRYAAVGLLEMLWHYTAQYAPRGDIGRHGDEAVIAEAVYWDRDPAELVLQLRAAGWLDLCQHGLHVHHWPDHADQAVQRGPAVAGTKAQQERKKKDPRWEWEAPGFSTCYETCRMELENSRENARDLVRSGKVVSAGAVAGAGAYAGAGADTGAGAGRGAAEAAPESSPGEVTQGPGTAPGPDHAPAASLWDRVLAVLEREVPRHGYTTWLRPTSAVGARRSKRQLVVEVPNQSFADWIRGNYQRHVDAALGEIGLRGWTVDYVAGPAPPPPEPNGAFGLASMRGGAR
jgi:hypothetical protein